MYTDNNDSNFNNDNNFDNNENLQSDLNVDNDFYKYENQQYEMNNKPKKSKKIILWVVIVLIILIALFGSLAFFYFRNNNSGNGGSGTEQPILTPNLVLNITEFSLKVNDTKKIEYTIENDNGNVALNWSSSDKKIATVDNTGTVKGVKAGTVTITASYTFDSQTYEKTCTVTVVKDSSSGNGGGTGSTGTTTDKTDPKLSISFSKGKENTWVNTDVVIKTTASDNSGSVTVEYALNCAIKTCDYKKVSNNTITISSENVTEVKIRAKDKAGNDVEKNVTVRIDKTKPSCALDVNSETGTLTAKTTNTGGSDLLYNGFSSSYSGTSGTSQTLTKAGTYTYYVKDKAGNTNTCSLEVKSKTQYRYQDCTSCKKCASAGCATYYWRMINTTLTYSCTSSPGFSGEIKEKICNITSAISSSQCNWTCSYKKKECSVWAKSCDKCGGCETYGAWSAWSDTKYTESTSRKVETKTIFVK